MTSASDYRLPGDILPIRYSITLEPDLKKFTFWGEETIEIEIKKQTRSILLNSEDLDILSAEIRFENKKPALPGKIKVDEPNETVRIKFDQYLETGPAKLNIKFTGILNDQLRGFYRSRYTNPEGETCYLATTQFEATDARKAFPCWDDPAIKATFKVSLIVPSTLAAISNMPIEKEGKNPGGKKIVSFKETPKMSTYLLAFIAGDLRSIEKKSQNGTLLRIWATRGNEERGRFALDVTCKLLQYFNEYFGIPYPMEKLDQIAIPDFAAGAMENWGAITYRETVLLFDPKNSAANTKQRIAEVVAHEMAHQWFGDLVTMEWWDDLWLNESFASWMGNKATDKIFPEWRMWTQFISADTGAGMSLDALKNSHPIEAHVKNPAEIRELFDAISYSKGAATIRMLEQFLGEEVFRKGINRYLSENSYSNARTEHLWKSMEKVSGKPVTEIMDTWIKQTGFPFLNAATKRSDGKINLSLTQNRFLYYNLIRRGTEPTVWKIPVNIEREGGEKTAIVVDDKASSIIMADKKAQDSWIKINSGQGGFYIVNYEPDDWNRLKKAIRSGKLSANDRLGLQSDSYALMKAGYIPTTSFLSFLEAYRNEMDATVLGEMATALRKIETLLFHKPSLPQFHKFARGILAPIAKKIGWDPKHTDSHLDSLRRSIVLGQLGYYGDKKILKEAKKRFGGYIKNPSSLHPDLRSVVFNLTAQQGDKKTYMTFLELEKKEILHEEKLRLLGALSHFHQKDLLKRTLELSLDPDKVRSQDTVYIIGQVFSSKHGHKLAWNFIKSNWAELDRRYGSGGFAITKLVALTGSFSKLKMAKDVKDFFGAHPTPSAARTVQQSMERIELNANWLKKNRSSMSGWLASKA